MKTPIYIAIFGILFLGGLYLVQKPIYPNAQVSLVSTSEEIDMSNWQTYNNEKYGFSYIAPTQKDYVNINPDDFFSVNPLQFSSSTPDLKSYADDMWNRIKNDKNTNVHDMPISNLEQITFNGRIAYRFTQKIDLSNNSSSFQNPKNAKFTKVNILTTNQNNQLFWIYYKAESKISEKILPTLKIDANLIAPKIKPDNWKVIKGNKANFEFSYPSNIFTQNNSDNNSTLYGLGKRGQMSVYEFEPSEYEKILNSPEMKYAKKVMIGNLYGYELKWAEGGNYAVIFVVQTNNHFAVNIRFSSNEDNIYPIANDADLQNQILSTFKFK